MSEVRAYASHYSFIYDSSHMLLWVSVVLIIHVCLKSAQMHGTIRSSIILLICYQKYNNFNHTRMSEIRAYASHYSFIYESSYMILWDSVVESYTNVWNPRVCIAQFVHLWFLSYVDMNIRSFNHTRISETRAYVSHNSIVYDSSRMLLWVSVVLIIHVCLESALMHRTIHSSMIPLICYYEYQ